MDAREFSLPVHRSLMQRELVLKIPAMGVLALLLLATFFMYILEQYVAGIPIAALYIAMRYLTKKDPYLIDIILEHINQKDILIP
jgi:type IV secretory pathway TrbD component